MLPLRRGRGSQHDMMGLRLSQTGIRRCRPTCHPPRLTHSPSSLVQRVRGRLVQFSTPAGNFQGPQQLRVDLAPLHRRYRALFSPPLKEGNVFADRHGVPFTSQGGRLILIDGKALVYRAYYKISAKIHYGSLKKMSKEDSSENSSWDSTMTTVFSLEEVLKVLDLHQPSHTAAVFDYPGSTFRHHMYLDYKSHRVVTPDTVQQAVRDTKHALLGMGVKIIEVPGVEADDVIGTLAVKAVDEKLKVRVMSMDRDFYQLLSPQLRLLRFQQGQSGLHSFGIEEFKERYKGLEVSQFIDMRALVGDVSDNIPGVAGIGEITALNLILEFGTLENLLQNRDRVKDTRARARLLHENGKALLSKELLKLKLDVPEFAMRCTLDDLLCKTPEDGGRAYVRLVEAYGAMVGSHVGTDILMRTRRYWEKLSRANS